MFSGFRSLLGTSYSHLNRIEISSSALIYNYRYLKNLGKLPVAPVLKSNAYGHGINLVAKFLDPLKVPFFCVDSLFEAYELQKLKIKTPVLIMGYVDPESLHVKELPFSYAVFTKEMLSGIKKYQPRAGIHLYADTGMHREGIAIEDLADFVREAQKLNLRIEGLMSHLAMGDKPNNKDTKKQIAEFQRARTIMNRLGICPKYVHLSASAGMLKIKEVRNLSNVARSGLALYGIDPSLKGNRLKPVLKFTSTVAQIKEISPGEKIGYDFTFTATKRMKIAIVPAGYNDGVDRRLSNTGFMLVKNKPCQILGRVSMNITIIDVTGIPGAKAGDEVVIFSNRNGDKNSLVNISRATGIIPYELLAHLPPTTKREMI